MHGRTYDVAYDNNGYASKLADSGGRTVIYTHDAAGHLTSEAGPVGTLTYQYDASNRMAQIATSPQEVEPLGVVDSQAKFRPK